MIEKLPALLLALVCALMLGRLCLPQARRLRVDAAGRRAWQGVVRVALRLWQWPASRRRAGRMADDAIRRARGDDVAREGNVYRPKSFRSPRKPH